MIALIKKSLALLLVPIVLLCTTGVTIYTEYCPMGKDRSYSFSQEKSCCCSNEEMHHGCCERSTISIKKIEDDFSYSAYASFSSREFTVEILPKIETELVCNQTLFFTTYLIDHPPPEHTVPFTILYRTLLI